MNRVGLSLISEEDDESGRRWCVNFDGSEEDDAESVRMMNEVRV